MKKFTLYLSCLLVFAFVALVATARGHKVFFAAPTTPATALLVTNIDGDRASVQWTAGNGSRRLVIVSKDSVVTAAPSNGVSYVANTTFGLGNELMPGQFVAYDGTSNSFDLYGLIPAHVYHVAVFEYNGSSFTIEYLTINPGRTNFETKKAPTQPATNLTATSITGNSMALSWTGGNGGRRLLVARKAAPVNANPTDLISYSSNVNFGSGAVIGIDNYALYSNQGTTEVIKNLDPGTTYHYAVFEYSGFWAPVYLTSSPATGSFATAERPSIAPTAVVLSGSEGNSMALSVTKGNGAKRLIVIRAGSPVTAVPVDGTHYASNASFGAGATIGVGEYVLSNNDATSVTIENLQPNTVYHFAVFEYDGAGTNSRYLTTSFASAFRSTATAPTTQASNISISDVTNNSAKISFTPGNGEQRLLIAREGAAANFTPVDLTTYTGNGSFGAYPLGNGNQSISNAQGSNVTMTGLVPGKTYHVSLYEFNGNFGRVYNTLGAPVASFTTVVTPTLAATGMNYTGAEGNKLTFAWTNGNGNKRIVIARAGNAVTAQPTDGTSYTPNATFGSGDMVSAGQYVVYNGTGSNFELKGLAANTTYHITVFEYSVAGTTPYYLRSAVLNGTNATLSAPTIPASALTSVVTSNTIRINFTKGNGSRRLILANFNGPVSASLTDFTFYGGGVALPGGTQILTNTGDNTWTMYGLSPNQTVYFGVIEFNGFDAPVYLHTPTLTGTATTTSRPTIEPTGGLISSKEGNTLQIQWTSGNGTKRLVVAKKGSPVTSIPADGGIYNGNETFGAGTEIAPDEFVVAATSSFTTVIKGLDSASTYHFAIFEYDGVGANTGYLTSKYLALSASTVKSPNIPATNLAFSNITATSATIGWTNGNGSSRLVIVKKGSAVSALPQVFTSYVYSNSFGSVHMGDSNYVVYKDNQNNTPVYNLEPGTTYHVAVYEYNGYTNPIYLLSSPVRATITTLGPPAVQASLLSFTHHELTSATLNWQNGSGQKRIVVAKKGALVDFLPTDKTTYNANSFFGSGQLVGNNNYIVYNGNGENVNITNLDRDAIYHFAIFEYNQFPTGEIYKATNAPRAILLTKPYTYDTTALLGMNASFTISSPLAIISYQWQVKSGNSFTNLTNSSLYSGVQSPTLHITGALANMHGYLYQCVVTTTQGTVASNVARLNISGSTLPVNFVAVKASLQGSGVEVEWKTAAETNVDRYEIERSSDGNTFLKVGAVLAKGGPANNYNLRDAAPKKGSNLYRIKAVDRSGDVRYSSIVTVKIEAADETLIGVYPNPVTSDNINLQLTHLEKDIYTLRLLSGSGQVVWNALLNHKGGTATETMSMPRSLPKGLYTLQLCGKNIMLTKQFIRQ